MLTQILKAILRIFCGPTAQQGPSQQHQQHQHQQHQQHHQQQQHQHQQYAGQGQNSYPAELPSHSHTPHHSSHYSNKHQDANQFNQHNEHYVSLRAQANEHGDQMSKCFQQSHDAYSRGDGASAKILSNQGKDHQKQMERLNREACDWIFVENNKDSKAGEVDLHGLYVKEAIARADEAIQKGKNEGQAEIHFIVGKGLHSSGGVARIRPAIEELIQKHKLYAELDPHNAGILIVRIDSDQGQGQRGIDAEEISHRLERGGESCIIM